MKTFSKFLLLCVFAVLSACGGGGGGVAGADGITTDADGRVGNIPKALVIIPSNAQTQ